MSSLEFLGILSAVLALVAFVGNEYGKLKNDNLWYDMLNLLSGLGLVVYAYAIDAMPFLLTNSVWAIVSGIDVAKYMLKKKRHRRSRRRV